jgi:hypothetical protein
MSLQDLLQTRMGRPTGGAKWVIAQPQFVKFSQLYGPNPASPAQLLNTNNVATQLSEPEKKICSPAGCRLLLPSVMQTLVVTAAPPCAPADATLLPPPMLRDAKMLRRQRHPTSTMPTLLDLCLSRFPPSSSQTIWKRFKTL